MGALIHSTVSRHFGEPNLGAAQWLLICVSLNEGISTTKWGGVQRMYYRGDVRKQVNKRWSWIPRIPGEELTEASAMNWDSNACL